MMIFLRYLLITLFLFFSFKCVAQTKQAALQCSSLDILGAKPSINGTTPCSFCEVGINNLKNGFQIVLVDTAYSIIGFYIYHTDGANQKEIQKQIMGNKVTHKNFKLLKRLKVGDQLDFECINIIKKEDRYLSTSFRLVVIR